MAKKTARRPTPLTECLIESSDKINRLIYFEANQEKIVDGYGLKEFGTISCSTGDHHRLKVFKRFYFEEVFEYFKRLEENSRRCDV